MALAVVAEIGARRGIVGTEPLRAIGVIVAAGDVAIAVARPIAVAARVVVVVIAVVAARTVAIARGIGVVVVVVVVAVAVPGPRRGDRSTDDRAGGHARPPAPSPPLHVLHGR